MTALGFLLIMLGIGAVIEGWHKQTLWGAVNNLFSGGTKPK